MFHGCRFDPDGAHAAADSTRSSTSIDTGRSVNPRTARRLVTAWYTSMITSPEMCLCVVPTVGPVAGGTSHALLGACLKAA